MRVRVRRLAVLLLVSSRDTVAVALTSSRRGPPTVLNGEKVESSCNDSDGRPCLQRRELLALSTAAACFQPISSSARGLLMFPLQKSLINTYHAMRVGETLLEANDILSTNPTILGSIECRLSPSGSEQVANAVKLPQDDSKPTLIRHSLAASTTQSTKIIADELRIRGEKFLPEFSFMDPRGIGAWNMLKISQASLGIWAFDVLEAGPDGSGARPPPNIDGTPNETLLDQFVRLRQLLSSMESQYSGEVILLIFPDGTGPALLSAMIGGIPYNHAHELEFDRGELPKDITPISVRSLYEARHESNIEVYEAMIEIGKEELLSLRNDHIYESGQG